MLGGSFFRRKILWFYIILWFWLTNQLSIMVCKRVKLLTTDLYRKCFIFTLNEDSMFLFPPESIIRKWVLIRFHINQDSNNVLIFLRIKLFSMTLNWSPLLLNLNELYRMGLTKQYNIILYINILLINIWIFNTNSNRYIMAYFIVHTLWNLTTFGRFWP